MMRRLLIFSAAFAVAAAGFVYFMPGTAIWGVIAAAGVLAAITYALSDRRLRAVRICLLGICMGLLWCIAYRAAFLGSAAEYDGQTLPVSVRALEAPTASTYGSSVSAELRLDGRRLECVLYMQESDPDILPGDTIQCQAKLKLAPGSITKEENRYARSRGIWFLLSAKSDVSVTRTSGTIRDVPARFAMAMRAKIAQIWDEKAAGFLSALLTGDRSGLSRQTRNELSIAGIYHTVAVSGMHVSILLGMVMVLCGNRKRLAAGLGIPVIVFFVLATGASASAIRAGVMQTLLLLAPLAERENDPLTSLGAAGLVLLMLNPWSLYDTGLQLSFASVAGILLFARKFQERLRGKTWFRRGAERSAWMRKLLDGCAASLSCSLVSSVFSLPLAAYYFGAVSLVAVAVNLLALWAVTVLFSAGMLIVLLAFVWTGLAYGPAWLLGWLAKYVLWVARIFSKVPCAAIYPENAYMIAWCVFYYLAIVWAVCVPNRLRGMTAALVLTLAVSLGLSYAQFHAPQFTFTALDVGQGQCLLFQRGKWTTVIDCGGEDPWDAGEEAARYLQSRGEYRVEALVITHYDADHAGGAVQLMERMRVDRVYLPDGAKEYALKTQILEKAEERGCEVILVKEDQTLDFDGGRVRIFAPLSEKNSNDSGICVLASAGEYDMLVTGDMTAKTELRLVEEKELPPVELLVAGHHGAATSTSYALLGRVRPQTVLICVGEDNTYGHPSPQTLERIAEVGAAVYRTDESGTITIRGSRHGETDDTKRP